jgi:uncharacterized protein
MSNGDVDYAPAPRPAWWIPGGHLQTAWAQFARSRRLVPLEREVLLAADGDELLLDHAPGPAGSPRVLLLHGLEGSAYSPHTQGLIRLVMSSGWRATVVNFRSCGRDPTDVRRRLPGRRARLYHSGDTTDLDLAARTLASRDPDAPLYGLGVSLGGNVLLKWLGETGAGGPLHAAATISVPYDLLAACRYLERTAARVYVAYFMRTLKAKALEVRARFPAETAQLDWERVRRARTLRELDQHLTAPLHGFADADDYYRRSGALPHLAGIAVPTLCISADDDPFLPAEVIARARAAASPHVRFAVTPWGGHAGFVAGRWPWRSRFWAEEQAVAWLARHPRPVALSPNS